MVPMTAFFSLSAGTNWINLKTHVDTAEQGLRWERGMIGKTTPFEGRAWRIRLRSHQFTNQSHNSIP